MKIYMLLYNHEYFCHVTNLFILNNKSYVSYNPKHTYMKYKIFKFT